MKGPREVLSGFKCHQPSPQQVPARRWLDTWSYKGDLVSGAHGLSGDNSAVSALSS